MMGSEVDRDFEARGKHNFKLYVLMTSKTRYWSESAILHSISRLSGYKRHKTVRYGHNTSHIHIKFQEEHSAKEAVEFLNRLNSGLTAILVDDMLREWFRYEMNINCGVPWTHTVVDIVGSPPLGLNFLTRNVLGSIFRDFGEPYLLPYTAALNKPHIQAVFGSMTQALAACIAFGEWYSLDAKVDNFSYRVRINPSIKEALLIQRIGGTPKEAFKLDYFVNLRNESPEMEQSAPVSKLNRAGKLREGIQNGTKKKCTRTTNATSQNPVHKAERKSSVLYAPVIASLNSYTKALIDCNKQLVNKISDFQQTYSPSTRTLAAGRDSRSENHLNIQSSPEESTECKNTHVDKSTPVEEPKDSSITESVSCSPEKSVRDLVLWNSLQLTEPEESHSDLNTKNSKETDC